VFLRSPRLTIAGVASRVAVVSLCAVALTSCTSPAPDPAVSSPSAPAASAQPSATPAPRFGADASTPEALRFFDATVTTLLKTDPRPHGRDVIDALVAAGFDKKAMEVTADQTTLGRDVDSLEFSVLWKKRDCLVGQVGSSGFGSTSSRVLSTGKCLVGHTRTIDW
jgi:hypothetical protein